MAGHRRMRGAEGRRGPTVSPLVTEPRKDAGTNPHDSDSFDLELLLRRMIGGGSRPQRRPSGAEWRGGTLALRPGTPGLQEKVWPIETFFHEDVMLRNRLRTLEQHLNASELPDDVKVKLQG